MVNSENIQDLADRDCPSDKLCQRDRLLLNLIRIHIMYAYSLSLAFTQIYQQLTQLNWALDRSNAIIVSPDGQVKLITQSAAGLLAQYFKKETSNQLPKILLGWLKHQILPIANTAEISRPIFPLQVEKEDRRLIVRLIPDLVAGELLILLEEQPKRSFSIASLQLIGLTHRESEILLLISQDKSNPEIARILNSSLGTVKKHLEHIYIKLNVQTRTVAVLTALTRLGLLELQLSFD